MATPWESSSSSSSLWATLGQASGVAQLVGVDALGLVSMVVQAALVARRHRDACVRLAQHVELVGSLLGELEVAELMRREATRRPLEQLRCALRRCYALVTACQDCGYLRRLHLGARMADELRAAQHEIDMFIRLIPLIALVDNSSADNRRAKGQLSSGLMVAVKRVDEDATIFGFSSELQLAKLQHTNLIRLLGWCIHRKERALVYEFMHNSSLDRHIYDRIIGPLLDWSKRLKIIKGVTEGLVYLHNGSMLWIVHRDLKPNNILLDDNTDPKISDFGSSRTLSSDVAEECTSRVVGTSGYKAPEYASQGIYSLKTDVFSFGVLVLVIISGRKNTILDKRGDTIGDLVRDAWHIWKDQRLNELVDPALGNGYDIAEITRCTQVALLCAQEDPADRPTMTDVAAMLNSESRSLPMEPKQPTALSKGSASEDTSSTYMGQSSRTIDITITSPAPMSTRVRIILDPEV
ncbi:hypothetical protein ACQ4PT_053748 [Festuca glaucescens]